MLYSVERNVQTTDQDVRSPEWTGRYVSCENAPSEPSVHSAEQTVRSTEQEARSPAWRTGTENESVPLFDMTKHQSAGGSRLRLWPAALGVRPVGPRAVPCLFFWNRRRYGRVPSSIPAR